MNKFLLVAINSKYIHSNLAVYCLKAATAYSDKVCIREFTINNQLEDILKIYIWKTGCYRNIMLYLEYKLCQRTFT